MGQKQSKSKSKKPINLKKYTVSDIMSDKKPKMVVLNEYTQVLVALKSLADKNILSAPVVSSEDKLMGFVDVLDIVFFLALSNKAAGNQYGDVVSLNVTCKPLIDFSKRNPLHVVTMKTPLLEVVKLMSVSKIHRVAVVSITEGKDSKDGVEQLRPVHSMDLRHPVDQSNLISIITQSDLVALLGKLMEDLSSDKLNKSIEELGIQPRPLQCCKDTDITAEAYLKMYELGFSSLGVVNEEGSLVNFLSGTQIKGMTEERLTELSLSVSEFLSRIHDKKFQTFSRSVSLRKLLECIIESRFHRVFFQSEGSHSFGLLTLTDLIKEMAFELKLFDIQDIK